MRRITATEAARRFSNLLDRVENRGETFVVERRGQAVATIGPATGADGRAVKAVLRGARRDTQWLDELRQLRASLDVQDRRWTA